MLHEGAVMLAWLKSRLAAWVARCQQQQIERLRKEGWRLKEELLKVSGGERITLSAEQRRRLREKAAGIGPQILKQLSLFDAEDLDPPSADDAPIESG
jgi:hypothetical protein